MEKIRSKLGKGHWIGTGTVKKNAEEPFRNIKFNHQLSDCAHNYCTFSLSEDIRTAVNILS